MKYCKSKISSSVVRSIGGFLIEGLVLYRGLKYSDKISEDKKEKSKIATLFLSTPFAFAGTRKFSEYLMWKEAKEKFEF